MLDWITANLATILITAFLLALCIGIVIKSRRDRKKGKTSCGCGCSGCSMNGMCHPQIQNKKENT